MSVQPVILCGGAGSRLWPLSSTRLPKQLLSFGGDESLLQATVERVREFAEANAPTIICNDEYRFLVADHMQSMGLPLHTIMLEPMGRNTAPAIAMAAFHALENDPILLVLPSDHLLKDTEAFSEAVHKAAELAAMGRLVTFGVKPQIPHTGYGYIKGGEPIDDLGFVVEKFVEKLAAATRTKVSIIPFVGSISFNALNKSGLLKAPKSWSYTFKAVSRLSNSFFVNKPDFCKVSLSVLFAP